MSEWEVTDFGLVVVWIVGLWDWVGDIWDEEECGEGDWVGDIFWGGGKKIWSENGGVFVGKVVEVNCLYSLLLWKGNICLWNVIFLEWKIFWVLRFKRV